MTEENQAEAAETTVDQTEVIEDVNVDSSTTEAVSETEPEASGEPKGEEKKDELPAGVKKRFGELTRDKYQLKEQLKQKDDLIATLQSKNAPQEPAKPNFDDFDSTEDFIAATDKYAIEKSSFESSKAEQHLSAQAKVARENEARQANFNKYNEVLKEQKPLLKDFEATLNDPVVASVFNEFSQDIVDVIWSSEVGPALSYHLATNLDEAERIASLTPVQAAAELARIESRIDIPKPKTVSNAPDPIKPANGKTSLEKKPADMTQEEHEAWRAKRKKARR